MLIWGIASDSENSKCKGPEADVGWPSSGTRSMLLGLLSKGEDYRRGQTQTRNQGDRGYYRNATFPPSEEEMTGEF